MSEQAQGGSSSATTKVSRTFAAIVTFEWTIEGVRQMLESTEGSIKSAVVQSPPFDDDLGNNVKWSRGSYQFSLEARTMDKTVICSARGPTTHLFDSNSSSQGWPSFWSRDLIAGNPTISLDDGFVLICKIETTSSESLPPTMPHDLLEGLSDIFNNPTHADVVFVIKPSQAPPQNMRWRERRIYAAKAMLLRRSEYFKASFSSGFAEQESASPTTSSLTDLRDGSDNLSGAMESVELVVWDEHEFSSLDYQPVGEHDPEAAAPSTSTQADTNNKRRKLNDGSAGESSTITEIVITDISYSTMSSLLYYLYTDRVFFFPLPTGQPEDDTGSLTAAQDVLKDPLVSANALYAAADKMGLDVLKKRASEYIKSQLSDENIWHQLFSHFNQLYPEFQQVELDYVLKNWADVREAEGLKRARSSPESVYPGYNDVMASIFKALVPAAAPSN